MRTRIVMLVCVLAGCGNVGNKQTDASVPVDATERDARTGDASAICDPAGKFDAPVPLAGFNTAGFEGVPRLSSDEIDLYFAGGAETDTNIYRARRDTASDAFGAAVNLIRINSTTNEFNPSVSSDGLTLFFESNREPGEGTHLYVSTRASRVGEFDNPSEVANVNSATLTDVDGQPFLTADDHELWFTSTRASGLGGRDLYQATWNGSSFGDVVAITALSSSADDFLPTLSADKLTVYLSSARPGGKGGFDIWTSHRSTTSDGFPAPTLVPELNSNTNDYVGWLSPDSCRIYFSSDIAGTRDIYVAGRHPK